MKNRFNILAATDYSKVADNALRYAIQMAHANSSALTFFHAYKTGTSIPEAFARLERTDENRVEFEESKLQQYAEHMITSLGIEPAELRCSFEVREGGTTAELLAAAKEAKADFVVLGTHSPGVLKGAFTGGHTWEAIKKEAIPVLAIPEETKYGKIKNIVFATEYGQSEIPLIAYLLKYAKCFNAALTIVHITNNVFSREFDNELFEKFKADVLKDVAYPKLNISLVKNNTLIEGLNTFCDKVKADWLVMSHEKTSFLVGLLNPVSFTKKMSLHTHIPLFAVPDGYRTEKIKVKKEPHNGIEYGDFFI